jgi:tight adherence protein C
MAMFLGAKMFLALAPVILGATCGGLGLVTLPVGIVCGCLGGVLGMIAPSFWLDHRKAERQSQIRRALPDALDMIVICLDGGMSLPAALQRVAKELRLVHPLLAEELALVQRSGEMGQPLPEALRRCATRFDLEEMSLLSRIVSEAERFGTSVVKSLRVHAETLRNQRRQRAEEQAHRAAVWLLFPTVLFILPVTFLVILAPAIIRAYEVFRQLRS